jgi:hypothetical protein
MSTMRTDQRRACSMALSLICATQVLFAQARNKADRETEEWRYELEAVGVAAQGTEQVKVWTYSKKPIVAMEQASKNAVHGVVFKGYPNKDRIPGQKPLLSDATLTDEQATFLDQFFDDGGPYQRFVSLIGNGTIAPEDRIKIGKEYKIGVVVKISTAELRKELERANIIKKLGAGF